MKQCPHIHTLFRMDITYCVIGWRQDENDVCPLDEDCFYFSSINEICTWPDRRGDPGQVTEGAEEVGIGRERFKNRIMIGSQNETGKSEKNNVD